MPPWSTSSAPQETSSTRRPSSGSVAQALGERDEHGDGGQVVVRARGTPGGARRRRTRPSPSSEPTDAGADQSAPAASGAERDQRRRAQHRPPQRQRGVDPLDDARERLAEPRLHVIVEDRAGRRGVVVGEHDQRALRVGVAAARRSRSRSVARSAVARRNSRGPLEMSSAIAAVTARGRDRRRASASAARAPRRRPARPPPPASRSRARSRRWNCSSSIVTASQPARSRRFAIQRAACSSPARAGAALDRRQRLDHLPQRLLAAGNLRQCGRVGAQVPHGSQRPRARRAGIPPRAGNRTAHVPPGRDHRHAHRRRRHRAAAAVERRARRPRRRFGRRPDQRGDHGDGRRCRCCCCSGIRRSYGD